MIWLLLMMVVGGIQAQEDVFGRHLDEVFAALQPQKPGEERSTQALVAAAHKVIDVTAARKTADPAVVQIALELNDEIADTGDMTSVKMLEKCPLYSRDQDARIHDRVNTAIAELKQYGLKEAIKFFNDKNYQNWTIETTHIYLFQDDDQGTVLVHAFDKNPGIGEPFSAIAGIPFDSLQKVLDAAVKNRTIKDGGTYFFIVRPGRTKGAKHDVLKRMFVKRVTFNGKKLIVAAGYRCSSPEQLSEGA